jgi:branched-chain amino acid transport system permease protein
MMEKFPNFAHTSFASIGTAVTYYLVKFYGWNPYYTWPLSMLIGGLVGVALYLIIVKRLKERAFNDITLTFTFYIISQIIVQCLAIFSYWILTSSKYQSNGFVLYNFDFRWNGIQGVGIVAPLTALFLVVILESFLKYSKHGIAMKATAEDEELAMSLGVNVRMIHVASWFISGSLAALAGSIIPMWLSTSVDFSDTLLISVMAGSVLGGLNSIRGAIIGGILTGVSKKAITWVLMSKVSVNMGSYEELVPILFLFAILVIEPNGLTAINWRNISVHNIKVNIRSLGKSIKNSLNPD